MLPHVYGQKRLESLCHGVVCILCLYYGQGFFLVFAQPCPARAENSGCGLDEFCLEIRHGAEGFRQFLFKQFRNGHRGRSQGLEVEIVVPCLGRIVENRTSCLGHYFLDFHILVRRTLYQSVQIVNIGLEMLAVMVFDSFLTYRRGEGILAVR